MDDLPNLGDPYEEVVILDDFDKSIFMFVNNFLLFIHSKKVKIETPKEGRGEITIASKTFRVTEQFSKNLLSNAN